MNYLRLILVAIGCLLSTLPAHARGKPGGGGTSSCLQPALAIADAVDNDDCVLNDGSDVILANGSVQNCGSKAVDVRVDLMVSADGGFMYETVSTVTMRRLSPGATWQAVNMQIPIPAGYPPNTLYYILSANVNRTSYRAWSPRLSIHVSDTCP